MGKRIVIDADFSINAIESPSQIEIDFRRTEIDNIAFATSGNDVLYTSPTQGGSPSNYCLKRINSYNYLNIKAKDDKNLRVFFSIARIGTGSEVSASPYFASTKEESCIIVSMNTEVTLAIPINTNYIYIGCTNSAGDDITPVKAELLKTLPSSNE